MLHPYNVIPHNEFIFEVVQFSNFFVRIFSDFYVKKKKMIDL